MAAPPPPPPPPAAADGPPKSAFSLYDNIHDPNEPTPSASISSAPVLYNQSNETNSTNSSSSSKKPLDAALRFQPIRRPQVKQTKPKATFLPKTIPKPSATLPDVSNTSKSDAPTDHSSAPAQKITLADWAPTEEDEWLYGASEKRQRGGRKKKNKKRDQDQFETDWDELYDPSRPTNVEEYLRSDEKVDEVRQWKALLYKHRQRPVDDDLSDSDIDESRPTNQFAPPPSYGFVPPPPKSPPPAPSYDANGEDAYARRLALSSNAPPPPPPPPPDAMEITATTISKAPIRYTAATTSTPDRSPSPPSQPSRPDKSTFAHRLMSKYGWTAGSGLGATSSGIITPLQAQAEKRRKKADADGGGWAEPAGKGKVFGGRGAKQEDSKFGPMSEVIVLKDMLENLPDLQAEITDGLGQEIGQECGEKYGRVERLYIDIPSRQVFLKFTSSVSALRAVNDLDGRIFNGNTIQPKFYNVDTFEKGIYS